MIPKEIKLIICEYVSDIWVNEAIWIFPCLKRIPKKIPTHLMHNENIKQDKLKKKTTVYLAKRLVKMKSGDHMHSVYFNSLHDEEIRKYCKTKIHEKLIQVRPVLTSGESLYRILPVNCYPILNLGYAYSMSVFSDSSLALNIPFLFIDFSIYN